MHEYAGRGVSDKVLVILRLSLHADTKLTLPKPQHLNFVNTNSKEVNEKCTVSYHEPVRHGVKSAGTRIIKSCMRAVVNNKQ